MQKLGLANLSTAGAIQGLRERLGKTQEEMADIVDMSLSGYQKWEGGKARPRGPALKALVGLCPDEETRALFGIRNLESRINPPAAPDLPDPYDELYKCLREIIDSGQSQLVGKAEEVLARLADNARHMTRKKKPKK